MKEFQCFILYCIVLLVIASCGSYSEQFIWDQLSDDARDGIEDRAAGQCERQYEADFRRITDESLRAAAGNFEFRSKSIINWFDAEQSDQRNRMVVLDTTDEYFLVYLEKVGGGNLQVHNMSNYNRRVYKVVPEDTDGIIAQLKFLSCTNQNLPEPNDRSLFENRNDQPVVITRQFTSQDVENRTATTYTYRIDPQLPIFMSLFAFERRIVTVEENVRVADTTLNQQVGLDQVFQEFDVIFVNRVKASDVEHCTFATTDWSGLSLSIPQPQCDLDNSLEEEIDRALSGG